MKGKLFWGGRTASDHGILITVGNKFKVLICDAGILTALQKYVCKADIILSIMRTDQTY